MTTSYETRYKQWRAACAVRESKCLAMPRNPLITERMRLAKSDVFLSRFDNSMTFAEIAAAVAPFPGSALEDVERLLSEAVAQLRENHSQLRVSADIHNGCLSRNLRRPRCPWMDLPQLAQASDIVTTRCGTARRLEDYPTEPCHHRAVCILRYLIIAHQMLLPEDIPAPVFVYERDEDY